MKHLSNGHEDHPNQHKNSHKLCDKMGHFVVNLMKVSRNWDSNMIRISQWRWSHCRTNTSVRRNKSIQQSKTMRIRVWYSSRKVNQLSKVIWGRKIIAQFTRSISSTRIGKPVLMMDIKVSKDKSISKLLDQENLIYVRWNRIKNHAQRRRWSIEEKEVRHWVKQSQSKTSKNLQSFLEISPMHKEVHLSHKLQEHAWVLESFWIKGR